MRTPNDVEEPPVLNGEKKVGHWLLLTMNALLLAILTIVFAAGRQIIVNTERIDRLELSQSQQDARLLSMETTTHDTNGYVRALAAYWGVKKQKETP